MHLYCKYLVVSDPILITEEEFMEIQRQEAEARNKKPHIQELSVNEFVVEVGKQEG